NPWIEDVEKAVYAKRLKLVTANARNADEIDAAFASLASEHADALIIGDAVFFTSRREQLVALASRFRLPTIERWRDFAAAGGLVSYGLNLADFSRVAGVYVGKTLKGEKPADLPVQQPTKFELVINQKIAQELGLTVPQSILGRADEVIE